MARFQPFEPFEGEINHFVECIQKGRPPRVGGDDGRWAVAMVVAGTRSFLEERPMYLQEIMTNYH